MHHGLFQKVDDSSFKCNRTQNTHEERIGDTITNQALAEACRFAYNDARYVNERAKNDIFLLSR